MGRYYITLITFGLMLLSCKTANVVTSVDAKNNISITSNLQEDPQFFSTIAPYKAKLEGIMNTVISHTNADLTKSGDNSNLGNLLADFTFEGAKEWAKDKNYTVDAAVINIGGIRSTIGVGNIELKHVYEVMPFENEVMIVKLKGSDLNGLYDYYAQTQKNNPVSKLYIETDFGVVSKALINDKKIILDKDYYIATSDYLAFGGDNMNFFKKGELISTGIKLRDLFIAKFKENAEVIAPVDVRILFKNKKTDENE